MGFPFSGSIEIHHWDVVLDLLKLIIHEDGLNSKTVYCIYPNNALKEIIKLSRSAMGAMFNHD